MTKYKTASARKPLLSFKDLEVGDCFYHTNTETYAVKIEEIAETGVASEFLNAVGLASITPLDITKRGNVTHMHETETVELVDEVTFRMFSKRD